MNFGKNIIKLQQQQYWMKMNNIYRNFLEFGHALHADVIVDLFDKFKTLEQYKFLTYAYETHKVETVHAMLIWESFDVAEGYTLREINKSEKPKKHRLLLTWLTEDLEGFRCIDCGDEFLEVVDSEETPCYKKERL
jgi:hypothetical protein